MLAWSEGTGWTSENQKSWLWRHCRRKGYLMDYSDHRKLATLNPKLKSTGTGRYQLFPLVGCLPQAAWPERLLSEKSGRWHCSRLRSVALYLWLIVVISAVGNRPLQQYLGFIAGRWLWPPEHKADSLIAKPKRSGGTVRDWCASRVTAIISALVICIIVCLSWAVNHYRDNAYLQSPARQNARELKLANAAITDMQMRQRDVAALDAKYTKELADAKAEMMLAWWCCRWSSSVAHRKAVCQSVREATTASAWIMQPSPRLADTMNGDYFTLRERLITM